MELVEVEAVEDRARPEGGHAVILLRGVEGVPVSARFSLRPLDADGLAPDNRIFLEKAHEPLAVTATADGIALSIGPGIADNAALVPGTVVEIVLLDAGWRGEFLWPAVTPLARPKRRSIMTRRAIADAPDPDMMVHARTEAASTATAIAAEAEPNAPHPTLMGSTTTNRSGSKSDARQYLPGRPVAGTAADLARERERVGEAEQNTTVSTAAVLAPAVSDEAVGAVEAIPPSAGDHLAALLSRDDGQLPVWDQGRDKGQDAEAEPPSHVEATEPAPVASAGAHQPGRSANAEATRPVPSRSPRGDTTSTPPPTPDQPPAARRGWSTGSAAAMAVALMIGGQIIAMRALDLNISKRTQAATPVTAASHPVMSKPVTPKQTISPQAAGVYDVLAAGPVSPRGVSASGISPARALEMAHTLQHGPEAGRDNEEAIYWLKRYVLATAGAEHSRIALTQLGSAYATPIDGRRDVTRAILAWEMAGALGDPVALCFLAALHEQGIGVAADPVTAENWYIRAAAAGGNCARMSQAGPASR